MAKRSPSVSDAELEVLKSLWVKGPGTVRELNGRLRRRRWAYTTVLTLLSRLRDKGLVASDDGGMAHVFRAAITREGLLRRRLGELADQICEGAATPLVYALVENHDFTAEEIRQLRQLLDQPRGRRGKKKPRKR